jgi:RimJ/RimL family protein N-acetyltransferase
MQPTHQETKKYYQGQESERLIYRPFVEKDRLLWEPFFHETAILGFVGMLSGPFKKMSSQERANAWIDRQIERQETGTIGQLAIIEKASGKFIGVGGIIARTDEITGGEWEITYCLLPEFRGKGYATEQSVHFKNWAFDNTSKESLISVVQVDNIASQNVAEKNGMSVEKEMYYFEMDVKLNRVCR